MGPRPMKYMGSKRAMLKNGLGRALRREMVGVRRFVDPFCGAGSVCEFVSTTTDISVIASDLQMFAVVLTRAVIQRSRALDGVSTWDKWNDRTRTYLSNMSGVRAARDFQLARWETARVASVKFARKMSSSCDDSLVRAYGGYYLSPLQAMYVAALRASAPDTEPERSITIAALVRAVSSCSASPGHTAQPFGPTIRSAPHLFAAWRKDLLATTRNVLLQISPIHARVAGRCEVEDAKESVRHTRSSDLVFLDPPYSDVQYSRFYHVLESVAMGICGEVAGAGRYPPRIERPQSAYSRRSDSERAMLELLDRLSDTGARVMVTFPSVATNGLTASKIRVMAKKGFAVRSHHVAGKFSTLGGNGTHRPARLESDEFVMVLEPRRTRRSIV